MQISGANAVKRCQNFTTLMQEEANALQKKVHALREELAGDVYDWRNVFLECVATDKDLAPNQTAKMHAIWNSRGGKEGARKAGAAKADVNSFP